jgi:glycosyltransferase involved in cell wall biosynthesis
VDATLAVIVPAFNEAPTLERVLRRVLLQPCVQQLIVVDDGSTDGSFQVAQRFLSDRRVSVYQHASNRGKGAAIRTAGPTRLSRTEPARRCNRDLRYRSRRRSGTRRSTWGRCSSRSVPSS